MFTGERDELLANPIFAGVDGADGGFHDLGDGLKGEFFVNVQAKKLLIGVWKMTTERPERVALLLAQKAVVGCGLPVDELVANSAR